MPPRLSGAAIARERLAQRAGGFDTLALYAAADESGDALYGGAAYEVVRSPETDAVCVRLAKLHGAADAVICPSGLSAVSTTIDAFAP